MLFNYENVPVIYAAIIPNDAHQTKAGMVPWSKTPRHCVLHRSG